MATTETPPTTAPTTERIPAVFPVQIELRNSDNEPLDMEVHSGVTRDINEGGLGLEIHSLPAALAEKLRTGHPRNLDIDIRVGRRTLRLTGKSTWVKVTERHGDRVGHIGVEYVGVHPEVAQSLLKLARRKVERGRVWRVVALATLALALIVGTMWGRAYFASLARLAFTEKQLIENLADRQRDLAQVQSLQTAMAQREQDLAKKEKDLKALSDQIARAEARRSAAESSLKNLTLPPPAGLDKSAVYHLERGRYFWDRHNEAAALHELEQAIIYDPSLAPAYLALGEANVYFGRLKQAVIAYRRYIELQPDADDADSIRSSIGELEAVLLRRPAN